ncbi:MAG TPA: hypothetical protein VIK01_29550 [Polyangiaceae bacterium]
MSYAARHPPPRSIRTFRVVWGNLWETTNRESAAGMVSRLHAAPQRLTSFLEVSVEPGVSVRVGHTDQTKSPERR